MDISAERPRLLALVTSSERILLLAGTGDGPGQLPATPGDDAGTISYVRRHLDGEVSGLRQIAHVTLDEPRGLTSRSSSGEETTSADTAPDTVVLCAARLVGHAPGRWSWQPEASEDTTTQPVVREVALTELGDALVDCPARALLAPLAGGGHLLDLLLGPQGASDPSRAH